MTEEQKMAVKYPNEPASARQVGYIMSLASKKGIDPSMFEMMFGKANPADLNRLEASLVLDNLKSRPNADKAAEWEIAGTIVSADGKVAKKKAKDFTPKFEPVTSSSPTSHPSRTAPKITGMRFNPSKPLPAEAPTERSLHAYGGSIYKVKVSKSGNPYALRLEVPEEGNLWAGKWDYMGQAPLRNGDLKKGVTEIERHLIDYFSGRRGFCLWCEKPYDADHLDKCTKKAW